MKTIKLPYSLITDETFRTTLSFQLLARTFCTALKSIKINYVCSYTIARQL